MERPPQRLQELVDQRFLSEIPADPSTGKKDWVPHFGNIKVGSGKALFGIDGVHSSTVTNAAGAPYDDEPINLDFEDAHL